MVSKVNQHRAKIFQLVSQFAKVSVCPKSIGITTILQEIKISAFNIAGWFSKG